MLRHGLVVAGLLGLCAALAVTSLLGDSVTWDEASHLTSGFSYLKTGDFRLAPDHPPLAKMWAALPVLALRPRWDPPAQAWAAGDVWPVGREWLFSQNDGQRLVTAGRCAIVALLLLTCVCVYVAARQLFGADAALLALALACLSPTFLAHGRLVTTDLPGTLCFLLVLLAFARLFERITLLGLLGAVLALGASSVTKFSWPLVLPALAVMALVAWFRKGAFRWEIVGWGRQAPDQAEHAKGTPPSLRSGRRAACLAVIGGAGAVAILLAIWSCFGWRYSPFQGPDAAAARMPAAPDPSKPPPKAMDDVWASVMQDHRGEPIGGATSAFVTWARGARLLPEAYLYGLAFTNKTTRIRESYLNGRFSRTGEPRYFPTAFAIKTPLATILLLVLGLLALVRRRTLFAGSRILLTGLLVFSLLYGVVAVWANINIGHRHLLPIYPGVFVLAGAAAGWLKARWGKLVVAVVLGWLALANAYVYPHYLGYFNELIGGPARGYLYLADSNIDWGQDLLRLRDFAARHTGETIKLAYFGSADPTAYVQDCEMLPSSMPFGRPATLNDGWYVVSVTQLLGVYDPWVRSDFWEKRKNRAYYERLYRTLARGAPRDTVVATRNRRARDFLELRTCRLLSRLRSRRPDERIGYSLLAFHLSAAEVDELVRP